MKALSHYRTRIFCENPGFKTLPSHVLLSVVLSHGFSLCSRHDFFTLESSYDMIHTLCTMKKSQKKLCSSVPWPVAPGPEALMALIAGMFSAISGICICIARNEMTENNFYIAMALNVLNTTILFGTPGIE